EVRPRDPRRGRGEDHDRRGCNHLHQGEPVAGHRPEPMAIDKRRVVLTGVGAVTPGGNTAAEFWAALVAGRSGIGPITRFDTTGYATRIAGELKGFDALKYIDKKDDRKFDRFRKYAVAASVMAVEDAGLKTDRVDATRFGALVGSGIGGIGTMPGN